MIYSQSGPTISTKLLHARSTYCNFPIVKQLGNPETYDAEDWRGLVDYAWSHAVVSDETHKIICENCDFYSNDTWSNEDCGKAVDEVLKQYKEIDIFSIYTPVCLGDTAGSDDKAFQVMMKRTSNMVITCFISVTYIFYNIIISMSDE